MAGDEDRRTPRRPSLKTHLCFNNYPNWKDKLRENCCKRVREDRTRLLWKLRLPEAKDQSLKDKEFIKSTFQDIVTDEFEKIKDSSLTDYLGTLTSAPQGDDALWEYDGIHTAYEGECEEILLEMQRVFYEDLRMEPSRTESESYIGTWEDEEDEYLARAVYEHMQLNKEQVHKVIWCPICKQGELRENCCHIHCTLCELKLNKDNEVSLELLQTRLAEAHAEHLDRGCRLKPKFCVQTRFNLTALYIECQGCSTFDVVI
ncbi:hypothetical protein F0562_002176 [Nyssa sinensis]|uniref:RPA-interacting protein N-terminal domain-containing protein n=1 Tax=Nyssa sinensis TaxID=561372 RepID=A0A5J5C8Y5_9ASTE|nr:hypothetical protein F0562_002176 [Nyssa sinensis]